MISELESEFWYDPPVRSYGEPPLVGGGGDSGGSGGPAIRCAVRIPSTYVGGGSIPCIPYICARGEAFDAVLLRCRRLRLRLSNICARNFKSVNFVKHKVIVTETVTTQWIYVFYMWQYVYMIDRKLAYQTGNCHQSHYKTDQVTA